jgi:hypothetical protein
MLIGSADIGGYDFEDNGVLELAAARICQHREVDALYFHLAVFDVDDTTITSHKLTQKYI